MASTGAQVSRRAVLVSAGVSGGGLLLGVPLDTEAAVGQRLLPLRPVPVGAWLRITPKAVTILLPVSEMGQGVATVLPMMVAEELDIDWRLVRTEPAPITRAYVNPMFGQMATGGSTSVRAFFLPLRRAGAAARLMLTKAAADNWGVAEDACIAEDGIVRHPPTGRAASYAALAPAAGLLPVPGDPPLRPRAAWRLLGTSVPRLDGPAKLDGSARFGIDVRLPGLRYAAVRHAPKLGGRLSAIDRTRLDEAGAAESITVVPLDDAVATVADSWWTARQALDLLDPIWTEPEVLPDDGAIQQQFETALAGGGAPALAKGNREAAVAGAAHLITAAYRLPFLAHGTPEPMNCTVRITPSGCDIWTPTQAPSLYADTIPQMLEIDRSALSIHPTLIGGGFGRRFEIDTAVEAVRIAQVAGTPVQTIWDREADFRRDFFRPASLHKVTMGLDETGHLVLMDHHIAAPSVLSRVYPAGVENGIDPTAVEGLFDQAYAVPVHHVAYSQVETGVPVGFWRGIGHGANAFVLESLIDEAAAAAGIDPYEYRRRLLGGAPRTLRVLDEAAARAGWGTALDSENDVQKGRGIAIHGCFGSIVAEVAEVSIFPDHRFRVDRVVAVADCGLVVHPDGAVAQIEGAIVFALGTVLNQTITIKDGAPEQTRFESFPLPTLVDTPEIEVHLMESDAALGGLGEPGLPPLAPAVANAVFDAVGFRARSLPIILPNG